MREMIIMLLEQDLTSNQLEMVTAMQASSEGYQSSLEDFLNIKGLILAFAFQS